MQKENSALTRAHAGSGRPQKIATMQQRAKNTLSSVIIVEGTFEQPKQGPVVRNICDDRMKNCLVLPYNNYTL